MIDKCALKIAEYIKHNSDITNSNDVDKTNYALQVILGELFKIIILILVFSNVNALVYYGISVLSILIVILYAPFPDFKRPIIFQVTVTLLYMI